MAKMSIFQRLKNSRGLNAGINNRTAEHVAEFRPNREMWDAYNTAGQADKDWKVYKNLPEDDRKFFANEGPIKDYISMDPDVTPNMVDAIKNDADLQNFSRKNWKQDYYYEDCDPYDYDSWMQYYDRNKKDVNKYRP